MEKPPYLICTTAEEWNRWFSRFQEWVVALGKPGLPITEEFVLDEYCRDCTVAFRSSCTANNTCFRSDVY